MRRIDTDFKNGGYESAVGSIIHLDKSFRNINFADADRNAAPRQLVRCGRAGGCDNRPEALRPGAANMKGVTNA